MSVEKILEKLLRGESDANIRFDELSHLLQAKGFKMRDIRKRIEGKAISGSTSAENFGKLQIAMKPNSYEMVIWWSQEDDAYIVDVPELSGCMAHGKTRQDAHRQCRGGHQVLDQDRQG